MKPTGLGRPTSTHHGARRRLAFAALAAGSLVVALPMIAAASPARPVSRVVDVSRACDHQNAEVEQAVDQRLGIVYEEWMGCGGIGFASSTDGGIQFGAPFRLPGSMNSQGFAWDPAVAVGPQGTVYAAFMIQRGPYTYPVVEASFDHGVTFPQRSSLVPPVRGNWGDRDFIAAAPDGTLYVTWDYGPSASAVTYICTHGGSCAFATGDLNVVVQRSTDGGRTWGPIVHVSPGFPASGGDSGPLVVEPDGRVDILYQGYQVTNDTTYTLKPAHSYFTASIDGGRTWSPPRLVGADRPGLTMSLAEWWIDGAIGLDAGGTLYATWDTQGKNEDIGWLSVSTDHGLHWSPLVRVTDDHDLATHIVEVVGASPGLAYVGWLTDAPRQGYAQYVRPYSAARGWLGPAVRISGDLYGNPTVWPGDTFGINLLSPSEPVVSWGSAVPMRTGHKPRSQVFAATISFLAS